MLRIVLIRPGSTDFDEQGRIKGTLDIPLNENGTHQVARTIHELAEVELEVVYCSPCQCAQQTAAALAAERGIRVKPLDKLRNLDHGLWHGKLIEEVRRTQPKVYRLWQDDPGSVCPPQGETLQSAEQRVRLALAKMLRKHRRGSLALVVSEPLASLVKSLLLQRDLGDLWKAACDCGRWELLEVEPRDMVFSG
ncbi:MAG: histidine phosphatase family protein [Pirellulaceae bacterium]|nr:histidine phosphatase family protein [Pirellulaceae bacterium]